MKSLKEFTGELKEKCTKKNLLFLLEMCFYGYFFLQMSLNLCHGAEAAYQVIRDGFNYEAICYLLGIVIVATRAQIWHWIPMVAAGLYTGGCCLYLHKMMFASEMLRATEMKMLAYGLFGVLIIDLLIRRQYVKLKERNWVLTGILLFAVLTTWIFCKGGSNTIYFLCPFAVVYCVRITEEKWKQLLMCFTVAYVISVAWIFGNSLLLVPYTGGRYWGVFLNLSTIGLFSAGAAVCGLFWIFMRKKDRWKLSWRYLPAVLCILGGLAAVSMISARTAQLGFICVIAFVIIFCPAKGDIGVVRKRFFIVAGSGVILLLCGFGVLWGLYQIDKETLREYISNDIIYNNVAYWHGRARTMFRAESRVFEHGTLLAMLDRFGSGRLGIWLEYIANLNLFGHTTTYLEEMKPHRTHAHNTYISFLYNYGIVPGGAFLCWYAALFITAVKKNLKGNVIYLLPALWLVLALGGMLTDTFFWIYPTQFVLLFLLYPLMVNIEKKEKKTNAES